MGRVQVETRGVTDVFPACALPIQCIELNCGDALHGDSNFPLAGYLDFRPFACLRSDISTHHLSLALR